MDENQYETILEGIAKKGFDLTKLEKTVQCED